MDIETFKAKQSAFCDSLEQLREDYKRAQLEYLKNGVVEINFEPVEIGDVFACVPSGALEGRSAMVVGFESSLTSPKWPILHLIKHDGATGHGRRHIHPDVMARDFVKLQHVAADMPPYGCGYYLTRILGSGRVEKTNIDPAT